MIIAGSGEADAPAHILFIMKSIARWVAEQGGWVRLSHKKGVEMAMAEGARDRGIVYLPASWFNEREKLFTKNVQVLDKIPESAQIRALKSVDKYHKLAMIETMQKKRKEKMARQKKKKVSESELHDEDEEESEEKQPVISETHRKIMATEYLKVFGVNESPVDMVVCWGKIGSRGKSKGEPTGSTKIMESIAKDYGIPVVNLNAKEFDNVADSKMIDIVKRAISRFSEKESKISLL